MSSFSHALTSAAPWLAAGGVSYVAWKVGRRWRGQYASALALRAHLENTVRTQSEALSALRAELSATASGNVVVIGGQDAEDTARIISELHAGSSARGMVGAGSARSVRAGSDCGPDLCEELSDDDFSFPDDVDYPRDPEPVHELGGGELPAPGHWFARRVQPHGRS